MNPAGDEQNNNNNDLRRRRDNRSSPNDNFDYYNNSSTTTGMLSYSSASEYATAVRTWLWAYQMWHWTQMMTPLYLHHRYLCAAQNAAGPSFGMNNNNIISGGMANSPSPPLRTSTPLATAGNRYVIPAFGRRVLAEAIDFGVCFILSLFITYLLVEVGIIELSRYEKLLSDQADLQTLIDVTQDLFPIEIGKKILTSVLEALFITYGFSGFLPAGSTPGKFLLGLKVIRCERVQLVVPPRGHYHVTVYCQSGGEQIPFARSLARSLIKNFSLGFLFPLCITMYVFHFNRALYDLAAGTIVVEA